MTTLDLQYGDRNVVTVSNLVDAAGAPTVFAAGDKLRWTAKLRRSDVDGDALITKTSTSGITFTAGQSTATITILPADWTATNRFPLDQLYLWDLQLEVASDATNVITLASGDGTIVADISRAVP